MEEKKKIFDKGTLIIVGITAIIISVCIIISYLNSNNSKDTYSATNTNSNYQKSSNNSNTDSNTSYSQVERQKITIIDFSLMSKEEIQQWCKQNKINCIFTEEYSEYIEKKRFY